MSITQEVSNSQEDSKLSVLTFARKIANNYPTYVKEGVELDDDMVLLAAIFVRIDKLVSIVEKVKIPRMFL